MLRPIPAPDPPPARRVNTALPDYRYVPGLNPHPFRHQGGHLYTDGSAPAEALWNPDQPWDRDERYLYALDLFDQRYWWEAHEAWEALWHSATPGTSIHTLLQGLIQLSAHRLKQHMGQDAGRLRAAAHRRLDEVRTAEGSPWRGVDLEALLKTLKTP